MNSQDNYQNLLNEACILLPKYVDVISLNIDNAILKVNENIDYDAEMIKIFERLSDFISIVSTIFRDQVYNQYDSTTLEVLRALKIHQLSIIKALKSAQSKNDQLMLTDLLEYELKDNLTQWKISAIPQLKTALKRRKSHNLTTF